MNLRHALIALAASFLPTLACSAILGDFTVGASDGGTNGGDAASDGSDAIAPGDAGCPSGQSTCPTGCVDLQKTAANCGVCGHTCNGGTCSTGTCGPYVVAKQPTTGTVAKLATDGKRVLWADTGTVTIEQIAAAGGTPIVLASASATNGAVGTELALAKTTVAFCYSGGTDPPSVGLAAVDVADSGAPVFIGTQQISGVSLDPSATHVAYVNTHGTQSDLNDCALNGRDAGACAGVGGGRFLEQTASDDTTMFFDLTGADIAPPQSGLYLDTVATNTVNIFGIDLAGSLAVDGTWAYWTVQTDGGTNYVVHRTLESSPGTQLQTPVPNIVGTAFATDGANVYYWSGTAIASRPVAGGSEATLAPASAVTQIAVGGGLLIWTDGAVINGLVLP